MSNITVEQAFQIALQHQQAGRLSQAAILYRAVLARQPNHAESLHLLGVITHRVGRVDLAVNLIRRAIAIRPDYPQAHSNLGNALFETGELDGAIAAYRQAVALDPDSAEAHSNLGSALQATGRADEAIAAYRDALALKGDFHEAHGNLINALHFHPDYDGQAIHQEQRRWNRRHVEHLQSLIGSHSNDRSPGRRLRIGYVSPDFRNHCQTLFTLPLLSHHDHNACEIFCYSSVMRADAFTDRIRAHADVWRAVVGLSDADLAEKIRADRIDLLVDLTMHMSSGRPLLFARKPAPVQIAWLAYPGSTGLSAIDYRLSDPYLDPPGMDESVYSEQTIRLPDSFWCYDPLEGREIPVNSLPALESGVVTFGCLNNFCKVNESVLTLWAQVLRQVQGSRLLLLAGRGSHRQQTAEFLNHQGVERDRVEFLDFRPRKKYLEYYQRIDLGLDSFPYNGHTTSLDSFWMGVPVVTLAGQTAVSRAGWCQLSNLGLPELAAQTPGQFVQIAVDAAGDLPRLSNLRQSLRQRMEQSPLMDAPRFARNIESAYRQMWCIWCEAVSARA